MDAASSSLLSPAKSAEQPPHWQEMMRSARHGWTQNDNSRFEFAGEIISFGETFTLGPMLAALGPYATAIWGQRLGALKCLILGFAPKGRRGGWLLYLLHPLQLFRHGMSAQSMYEGATPLYRCHEM